MGDESSHHKHIGYLPPSLVGEATADKNIWQSTGESYERRWGLPYERSFLISQETLFIPSLKYENDRMTTSLPSVLFVKKDFMKAFFGDIPDFSALQEDLDSESACSSDNWDSRIRYTRAASEDFSPLRTTQELSIVQNSSRNGIDSGRARGSESRSYHSYPSPRAEGNKPIRLRQFTLVRCTPATLRPALARGTTRWVWRPDEVPKREGR